MSWAGRPQHLGNAGESQQLGPNDDYDDRYYKGPETSVQEQRPSALGRLRGRFPFLYTKKGIAVVVGLTLLVVGGGLAGLAALPRDGGNDEAKPIADDAYFYGLSPAVYPSRKLVSFRPDRASMYNHEAYEVQRR